MSDYQIKVGPRSKLADGVDVELRGDSTGAQVVTDAHGRYHEGAVRRQLYTLDSDAVTLAAANTTKGAMGTAKFINGFWNPPGSGFNASILRARISVTSGTPTGPFCFNYFPTQLNVTSAATGTIRSTVLSSQAASQSAMRPMVGVILAVLPADTEALIQSMCIGGPAAIAAGAAINSISEEIAGEIIVPPGVLFGIMQVGASTTLVQSTLTWEECAILAT